MLTSSILSLIPAVIAVFIAYLLSVRYRRHLGSIPGPFLASFTPIPRLLSCAKGHQYSTHIRYHQKYGPVVRIGPNHVSFSDGEALSQIYNINTRFEKSNFYRIFDAKTKFGNVPTVFSIRDERSHRAMKRPVANAYSMSTMVELEPLTDEAIRIFERKIDEKLNQMRKEGNNGIKLSSATVDLGEWLHFFSFDVITSITFSNMMGFIEQEKDIGGIIDALEGRQAYNSVVGQTPCLHDFLLGNPVVSSLASMVPSIARFNTARYIVQFAASQLERYKQKSTIEYRDMLDRFKRTNADGETIMSEPELLSHAVSNIFAGSDTTAISLRSMFYYLCRTPRAYSKLLAEIDEMATAGNLSEIVTFSEANSMPYLQACMKEAMRLHPAVGMLLERIVPPEGITISGHFVPGGTIVGANPWVVARDHAVYGEDVDTFRPERWLDAQKEAEAGEESGMTADAGQSSTNTTAKLKTMERNFLAFGAGSRTCLGKNISLLEMSKLVPQILRKYKVELADPEQEWQLQDYWFVKQTHLICKVQLKNSP